jgi:hypothetical protein
MATKLKQASIVIRQNKGKDLSPKWEDSETLLADAFHRKFKSAMDWYRLEKTAKELKPKVIDWMGRNGYDKETIQAFKKTKDNRCSGTVGAIAACLIKGMPAQRADFNNGRNTEAWLREQIASVINDGQDDIDTDEVADAKKPLLLAPVVTIQDRMRDQAIAMSDEIDEAIDSFLHDPDAFDPKAFKMVSLLRGKGVKAAHSRFIKGFFQRGYNELLELSSGEADEQLREGYSHLARKNVKKLIDFYASIMAACDQIAAEAKVLKKPRAKKVKPAEELVKKLKFRMSDDKLGITSVPPVQLVKAMGCVVYNTKNRKIGYYISTTSEGFTVKNSTLGNFTVKSIQKTLRKPEVQLKEFKDQNTQKRFETWFDKSVKTTETVLNGRFTEDTIILKVYK